MSNSRHFFDTTSPFTAKVLFAAISKDENDWPSEPHSHYFTEIFYILSGNGEFLSESKKYEVHPNEMLILNPQVQHTEYSVGLAPMEYVVIGIEGIHFDGRTDGLVLIRNLTKYAQLPFYLNALISEIKKKSTYQDFLCQNLINIILIHLLQSNRNPLSILPYAHTRKECEIVKDYMDKNFRQKLTLEDLSALVHWNKYHLAHVFSDTYGQSPIRYLLQKRIEESKYLLSSTNYSLNSLSAQAGFSSPSYFAQMFRKTVGMSPLEYRRQTRICL